MKQQGYLFETGTREIGGAFYTEIAGVQHWRRACSGKFDRVGADLADRHYSRRTPGSPQFMPPGQTIVMLTDDLSAVWGWHRPHPTSGVKLMSGLDGWTCCIFRNEGRLQSSDLIIEAEKALANLYPQDCGPDGMITYVFIARVRSRNPGYCFKMAGWSKQGMSADGKKVRLGKPFHLAGHATRINGLTLPAESSRGDHQALPLLSRPDTLIKDAADQG